MEPKFPIIIIIIIVIIIIIIIIIILLIIVIIMIKLRVFMKTTGSAGSIEISENSNTQTPL